MVATLVAVGTSGACIVEIRLQVVGFDPQPFEPVLDGLLLTGTIPHYLHGDLRGGRGEAASSAEVEPTWWPPTKIAGGHLSRYVARLAAAEPPDPDAMWLRLETDDLEAYLHRAGAGTISVKP